MAAPARRPGQGARQQAGGDRLRRDRRGPARAGGSGRLRGQRERVEQLRANFRPDHVLGRSGLRERAARRRLPSVQSLAGGGPGERLAGDRPPWRARRPGTAPIPTASGAGRRPLGLLAFTWIELVSEWGQDPRMLATAICGYSVLTWLAMAVYGVETWADRGETFSVYYNLLSRISPFETRDRVLGVRAPLGGLPRLDVRPGTVAFVLVMIGTVTFDGLSQGQLWRDLSTPLDDELISARDDPVGCAEDHRDAGTAGMRRGGQRLLLTGDRRRAIRGRPALGREAACVRSCTRSSRSRWCTWQRTTSRS